MMNDEWPRPIITFVQVMCRQEILGRFWREKKHSGEKSYKFWEWWMTKANNHLCAGNAIVRRSQTDDECDYDEDDDDDDD